MKNVKAINKRLSLRARLTLLVATILSVVCVIITALSYYNAYSGMRSTASIAADVIPAYYMSKAVDSGTASTPAKAVESAEDASATFTLLPEARDIIIAKTITQPRILFLQQSLAILLCVIILSSALVYWAAGKALEPVTKLAERIEEISEDNLSQRISASESSKEAVALAGAFNNMLDRLEQAFLLQKQFAASAAHELKTPLASIQANVEALYMDDAPGCEDYAETMEIVSKNTSRLIVLVEQLLSITRKANVETAPCNLDDIAHNAAEKIEKQYPNANITIKGSGGEINGSKELLLQMLYNLLENSEKYAGDTSTTTLSLARSKDAVVIAVEDSGCGIGTEAIGHIFEPFYRADSSRNRKTGGSGLGLSIVKTIAEQHGGTAVASKSELGGAKFTITVKI